MDKSTLSEMIDRGMGSGQIARLTGKSPSTIKYWLKKYDLRTRRMPAKCLECGEDNPDNFYGHQKSQCKKCFNVYVYKRSKEIRRIVIDEHGGKCSVCGYNKYIGALEFHHTDSSKKDKMFMNSSAWSLERLRKETETCIVLCANCHREVEAGITIPS